MTVTTRTSITMKSLPTRQPRTMTLPPMMMTHPPIGKKTIPGSLGTTLDFTITIRGGRRSIGERPGTTIPTTIPGFMIAMTSGIRDGILRIFPRTTIRTGTPAITTVTTAQATIRIFSPTQCTVAPPGGNPATGAQGP